MSEPEHLGGKRAESARLRRAEQLRRWKGSLTEQEPVAAGGGRGRHRGTGGSRVRFEEGAVFLAACSSGDTEEVKRLLGRGARINTTNVDGLTALHQVPGARARGGGAGPGGSGPAVPSLRLPPSEASPAPPAEAPGGGRGAQVVARSALASSAPEPGGDGDFRRFPCCWQRGRAERCLQHQ